MIKAVENKLADPRSDESVLSETVSLSGLTVLDVGSGTGAMVRYVANQGAFVTGLECGLAQLEKARSYQLAREAAYVEGVGQEMPFDDNGYDVVTFFNSLHHIPIEHMDSALKEANRVAKRSGLIYIAEPIPSGSGFYLHEKIDDEILVRAAAYKAIERAAHTKAREMREFFYSTTYYYKNYEAFKQDSLRVDPSRDALFDALQHDLRADFDRLGVPCPNGIRFDQPMRVNVLAGTVK